MHSKQSSWGSIIAAVRGRELEAQRVGRLLRSRGSSRPGTHLCGLSPTGFPVAWSLAGNRLLRARGARASGTRQSDEGAGSGPFRRPGAGTKSPRLARELWRRPSWHFYVREHFVPQIPQGLSVIKSNLDSEEYNKPFGKGVTVTERASLSRLMWKGKQGCAASSRGAAEQHCPRDAGPRSTQGSGPAPGHPGEGSCPHLDTRVPGEGRAQGTINLEPIIRRFKISRGRTSPKKTFSLNASHLGTSKAGITLTIVLLGTWRELSS